MGFRLVFAQQAIPEPAPAETEVEADLSAKLKVDLVSAKEAPAEFENSASLLLLNAGTSKGIVVRFGCCGP